MWGLPVGLGGCRYKDERLAALANLLRDPEAPSFDVLLLQELWMASDHAVIAQALPEGFHITPFRALSSWACDGILTPIMCR